MLNSLLTSSYCQIWDFIPIPFQQKVAYGLVVTLDDDVAFTYGENIIKDSLFDFSFSNDTRSIFKTINGGETWEALIFNGEADLNGGIIDICATSKDKAFITYLDYDSGKSYLYQTINGGASWQKNDLGITNFLNFVRFFDPENGIAFGDPNEEGFFEIVKTNDGGLTWVKQPNVIEREDDSEFILPYFCYNKNNIWVLTSNERILYSPDRGSTWNEVSLPNKLSRRRHLQCDENSNLYLGQSKMNGLEFSLFKKLNNETEWKYITMQDSIGFIEWMTAVPGSNSILLNTSVDGDTTSFRTIASTNGGKNWEVVDSGRNLSFGHMSFASQTAGYATQLPKSFDSPTTGIFKYNNSPLSGLFSGKILDASVTLLPNPAQEVISVKLTTDDPQDFWILINDLDGKLMAKKAISDVSSFTETIRIDHLPAGSYIVKVLSPKGQYASPFVKL